MYSPRRWVRPLKSNEPQIANACPGFTPLTPVSLAPAAQVLANLDALLPGKEIPLIWERTYTDDGDC